MAFTLLPAVDVADGKVMGLDPLTVVRRFRDDGAEWIHLVDLDAAYGRGSNAGLLASMVAELDIAVEWTGGITDEVSLAAALSSGCARAVLASSALADRDWCARAIAAHGDRVAVALDVRTIAGSDGAVDLRLAPRGSGVAGGDLWDELAWLDRAGCRRYIVTDVERDGAMTGPNLQLLSAIAGSTDAEVIASGGVAQLGDILELLELAAVHTNLEGAVVGTAFHSGAVTLPDALAAVARGGR